MEDLLFTQKLELLQLYYPSFLADALSSLLHSCGGSVEETRDLIDPRPSKKAAHNQASLSKHIKLEKASESSLAAGAKRPLCDDKKSSGNDSLDKKTRVLQALPKSLSLPKKRRTIKVITVNSPEDVARHFGPYASLHRTFLPEEVADGLLHDLAQRKDKFIAHKFSLFGNACVLNHGVATFSLPDSVYPTLVYNGLVSRNPIPYTSNFDQAANIIQKYLNDEIIPSVERLPFQHSDTWTSDYCVANYYEKLSNNLEWHSDRLSHIGPHNFVASISLGSTRMFRLRSTHRADGPIFEIPLPHNSLFLMRPGCQEEFKHCISSMSKAVALHPLVGSTRFGLTFRHYPKEFILNLPKCKCGLGMTLRRTYKAVETRGKYFWLCENKYQNKDCGTFHWCDFSNWKDHFVAEDPSKTSIWIAPEDLEKLEYERCK